MKCLLAIFAPLALVAAPAAAQERMTQAEQAAVQTALNRGTLLYYYDQAAWHGTDDMLAKIGARRGEIGGWIVDGSANAPELVFHDKNAADPHAIYVARFEDGKLISGRVLGPGEDRTLSLERKHMVAALAAARAALLKSDAQQCVQQSFNTVVLPSETKDGPSLVYFLTPQTSNDAIPLGAHYSFPVTADGKVGAMRRFTKSCIALPLNAGKDGKPPSALMITHLLDPTPTEIHIFSMLAAQKVLYVAAGKDRLWAIESIGGRPRVRLLDASKVKSEK